jgi:hypothetical protein
MHCCNPQRCLLPNVEPPFLNPYSRFLIVFIKCMKTVTLLSSILFWKMSYQPTAQPSILMIKNFHLSSSNYLASEPAWYFDVHSTSPLLCLSGKHAFPTTAGLLRSLCHNIVLLLGKNTYVTCGNTTELYS